MINCYEGYMDTNLVIPVDVNHCSVIFDFYFADIGEKSREYNERSVNIGNRVQEEDLGICEDVQRGLKSRASQAGRLSVRREAGEQWFHRLLAADLKSDTLSLKLRLDTDRNNCRMSPFFWTNRRRSP
jgi:choline monooxygenase